MIYTKVLIFIRHHCCRAAGSKQGAMVRKCTRTSWYAATHGFAWWPDAILHVCLQCEQEKLEAHAAAGFTTFDTADIYGPSERKYAPAYKAYVTASVSDEDC